VALTAALLVVACTPSIPNTNDLALTAKPADQLFREARESLSSQRLVRERYEFDRDGVHNVLTVTTDKQGGATGTWREGSGTFDFVQVAGRLWARPDRAYLAAKGRNDTYAKNVLPGHWEVWKDVKPFRRGTITLGAGDLYNFLNGDRTDLRKGPISVINGVRAMPLSDAAGDTYVSATNPARFVRAVWRGQSAGASRSVTDFSYPSRQDIMAPTEPYDPDDPATLPARHHVTAIATPVCDSSACRFAASLTNIYGKPVAPSTLTFHVTESGSEVISCSTPIPALPHGGAEDVSCSAGGPAWTAFYNRGLGFNYQPIVHDPLWDD
jgi:hypothetical protein